MNEPKARGMVDGVWIPLKAGSKPRPIKYVPGFACESCGTDFCRHDDQKYGSGSTCNDPTFTPRDGNESFIRRKLGGIHCHSPMKDVLKLFAKTLNKKTIHPAIKAGIVKLATRVHLENRRFGERMGAMPSVRLMARVMSGELKPEDIGL